MDIWYKHARKSLPICILETKIYIMLSLYLLFIRSINCFIAPNLLVLWLKKSCKKFPLVFLTMYDYTRPCSFFGLLTYIKQTLQVQLYQMNIRKYNLILFSKRNFYSPWEIMKQLWRIGIRKMMYISNFSLHCFKYYFF